MTGPYLLPAHLDPAQPRYEASFAVEVGIPAGGTFTGAEETKNPEQAEKWGGKAGEAFDACYHQACDTVENVDAQALERNFAAIANAVKTYAAQFPQP